MLVISTIRVWVAFAHLRARVAVGAEVFVGAVKAFAFVAQLRE